MEIKVPYPSVKCWARGKSAETGELVYGNYVEVITSTNGKTCSYIYVYPNDSDNGERANALIEVIEETVQRYTGLIDGSCNEIYEGDIVELPTGERGRVCFELGTWAVSGGGMSGFNWKKTSGTIKEKSGKTPRFLNSNFVSFYELIENFCPEDAFDNMCSAVQVIPQTTPEERKEKH